jgi:hypothetical protein
MSVSGKIGVTGEDVVVVGVIGEGVVVVGVIGIIGTTGEMGVVDESVMPYAGVTRVTDNRIAAIEETICLFRSKSLFFIASLPFIDTNS